MQFRHHALSAAAAILWLTGCDKPPASATRATADKQLVEARDALQRQALEIETKTALMEKRVAEMERSLKEQENAGLRTSINALQQENEDLRAQAEDVRRQSDALSQRLVDEAPVPSSVVQQPAPAPDYSFFYESLAPYGRWLEVAGYGYCWQPTVSVAGWRPYWDGCWVWSEFGWAWQSNEPFGWLTYHYGRWVELSQYGWVWVPGSEWAPGWVAWRQSPDCVGWAPLPPEPGVCDGVYRDCDSRYGLGPTSYVFIPIIQFVSPTYISVYAPVGQYNTIYRQSVNVTQIVPRSGHRHAFVQQGGPPRAQMEQACGRGVPQRRVLMVQAGQVPSQQQRRDQHTEAPIAMLDLPAVGPGVRVRPPEIREHVLHPMPVRGFAGGAATETPQSPAMVRQDPDRRSQEPAPEESSRHVPIAPGPVPQEMVRPAVAAEQAIAGQHAQAAGQDQRRQQEMNERAMADRRAAEQAAAAQQQQEAANQQRMTAEQERIRRAAEATAMQQQQDESNRRAAEEQMRTRQETERRTQEMARRQAEEQTRRAAEEQMKAQQESERQARQEAAQRAQEMAQRQAEEQARRVAEEQSRRAAEEQIKARQEAAQRAQEMARHQAEEQARRATEEASRRAQEEAHRSTEAARNQPSRP